MEVEKRQKTVADLKAEMQRKEAVEKYEKNKSEAEAEEAIRRNAAQKEFQEFMDTWRLKHNCILIAISTTSGLGPNCSTQLDIAIKALPKK
jgi:membrane protein involved in colicin uptake